MRTAREILAAKSKKPTTIGPDSTMLEALRLMAETDVGAALVVQGGRLVGVVSERDFARKTASQDLTVDASVGEYMTTGAVAVPPDFTVADCMALMLEKRVRHLPVLEGDTILGVVSVRDVVKAVLDEKEYVIDQLVGYISGRP